MKIGQIVKIDGKESIVEMKTEKGYVTAILKNDGQPRSTSKEVSKDKIEVIQPIKILKYNAESFLYEVS